MSKLLNISLSPYVRTQMTTKGIMYDAATAMIPVVVYDTYQFGIKTLLIILATAAAYMLSEFIYQSLMGLPVTISDGSALVIGSILTLSMSLEIPLWIPFLGGVSAITVARQVFSDLGQNFMNPVLAVRCFLLISLTGRMSIFVLDGASGVIPLAMVRAGQQVGTVIVFIGRVPGTISEVPTLALLIGTAYLLTKRVISIRIPGIYILTFAISMLLLDDMGGGYVLTQACGGGSTFGAFFMATDYVTSLITVRGQIMFGTLLGILTDVLRPWGGSAGGVSCATIFYNILVPLIGKVTISAAFSLGKGVNNIKRGGFMKGVLILLAVALISDICLGGMYETARLLVQENEMKADLMTYQEVHPSVTDFKFGQALQDATEVAPENSAPAGLDIGSVEIPVALNVADASGSVVGHAFIGPSKDGYGGNIKVSVGVANEGEITGIGFIEINEAPGPGMNAANPDFRDQSKGKTAKQSNLVKDGGAGDDGVDAISDTTVTSTAVTNVVNGVLYLTHNRIPQQEVGDDE